MSKAAEVLQNAIEVECHDILHGVDGKTCGCLFHGDEAERLIDAAVAPLVEVADAADYLIEGLRKVNRSEVVTDLDERFERYRIATKALEQWRTGR